MTGTVAASLPLTLRQPGMETRCPEGAGQRQRSWLGAKHDSPGSRQGSRPSSAKSVRKYRQQDERKQEQEQEQEQEQATYYHRQKKTSHTGQKKLSPGMRKIRPATGRMLQD
ncbi:hypothetical protein OA803_20110 [Citrobacter portucalensis]|nr:hypothetical protein [Citrobacter portucalensis]MDN4430978.1 hypothetical protein [Citrobacter portucalensis]MDN4461148.1 hypothetical protein [Citrobacter portucalensis]